MHQTKMRDSQHQQSSNNMFDSFTIPPLELLKSAKMYPSYRPSIPYNEEEYYNFLKRKLDDACEEFENFKRQCQKWAAVYQDWVITYGKSPNKELLFERKKDWWSCVELCEQLREQKERNIRGIETLLKIETDKVGKKEQFHNYNSDKNRPPFADRDEPNFTRVCQYEESNSSSSSYSTRKNDTPNKCHPGQNSTSRPQQPRAANPFYSNYSGLDKSHASTSTFDERVLKQWEYQPSNYNYSISSGSSCTESASSADTSHKSLFSNVVSFCQPEIDNTRLLEESTIMIERRKGTNPNPTIHQDRKETSRSRSRSPIMSKSRVTSSAGSYSFFTVESMVKPPTRRYRPKYMLWILRGLPYSGKTMFAEKLSTLEVQYKSPPPMIFSQKLSDPIDTNFVAIKDVLNNKKSQFVIFDSVNSKVNDFAELKDIAERNDYNVYAVNLTDDPMTCSQRCCNMEEMNLINLLSISSEWENVPENLPSLNPTSLLKQFGMFPQLKTV